MKLFKYITITIITATIVSCSTKKEDMPQPFDTQTLLVIPPICTEAKSSETIGRSLSHHLTSIVSSDTRYAGDIPQLKDALKKENLVTDGQINGDEITRIGSAIRAHEIVCVRLISLSSYPPQRATAVIMLRSLEGNNSSKVSTLSLSLNDVENRKEFADFVKGQIRGPLGDRFVKKTNVNLEAAMLSNSEFNRYIGYKIAMSIKRMKY